MPPDRPRTSILALTCVVAALLAAVTPPAAYSSGLPRVGGQTALSDPDQDPPDRDPPDRSAILSTVGWATPVSVCSRDRTTLPPLASVTAVHRPLAEDTPGYSARTDHLPPPARILFGNWRN